MALATQFLRTLDEFFERRTERLKRLVVRGGQGQPKKFSKDIRDRLSRKLLEHASALLLRQHAKRELNRIVLRKHLKHITGHGHDDRYERMWRWAEQKLDGPIVYSFWRGRNCLYVGKGRSPRRLRHYERHVYLLKANRLRVWEIRSPGQLPRAECLAIHLSSPRDNKTKAAKVKWGKSCPICRIHDKVSDEIKTLFKMRK